MARCDNSARVAEPRKGAYTGGNTDLAVFFELEKSDAEVANRPGKCESSSFILTSLISATAFPNS